ncbi:MAG TPA: hypothetical protein VGO57_11610 [Verrucomicrobiae bacterium]|jgi:hypothetical protein
MEKLEQAVETVKSFCASWGDTASVAGLFVSVIGFVLAIKGITTAKRAAQQAESAARQAKDRVLSQGTLAHFSSAVAVMEEIIRLQRKKDWENALDRHSELRRLLVELKDGGVGISPEQATIIQGTIEQFKTIEGQIEKTVSADKPEPNAARINGVVKDQIAKMQGIAISLKNN